jgi:hypothetical protein
MNKVEEEFYEIAAKEIATKKMVPALAAKAFSDADGDERKTFARYIKLRVEQLEVAWRADTERRRRADEERQRDMSETTEKTRNQNAEQTSYLADVANLKAKFSRYSTAKLQRMHARRGRDWYRPAAEDAVRQLLFERGSP